MEVYSPPQVPGRQPIPYKGRPLGRVWYISRARNEFLGRVTIRPSGGFSNCTL